LKLIFILILIGRLINYGELSNTLNTFISYKKIFIIVKLNKYIKFILQYCIINYSVRQPICHERYVEGNERYFLRNERHVKTIC
jgi:hypothetical protein